jgi:hypothetical protein
MLIASAGEGLWILLNTGSSSGCLVARFEGQAIEREEALREPIGPRYDRT